MKTEITMAKWSIFIDLIIIIGNTTSAAVGTFLKHVVAMPLICCVIASLYLVKYLNSDIEIYMTMKDNNGSKGIQ